MKELTKLEKVWEEMKAQPFFEDSGLSQEEITKQCQKFVLEEYGIIGFPRFFHWEIQYLVCAYMEGRKGDIENFFGKNDLVYAEYDSWPEPPKIVIRPQASKKDVLKFVDKNWREIKPYLQKLRGPDAKRIRRRKDYERDRKVRELYKKTPDELRQVIKNVEKLQSTKGISGRKYELVARVMHEKYKTSMTGENVKRIVRRKG